MGLGILGNPENRRVIDFQKTWSELGYGSARVMSYQELLQGKPLPTEVEWWRLDSPGENAEVARALIRCGGGPPDALLEFGQIAFLSAYHRGYCNLLDSLNGLRCFNAPTEIALMFDKWACHQRFQKAGLARPPSYLAETDFDTFRSNLDRQGRLFLKPLHGSSASGVCALRWTPARQQLIAPLKLTSGGLFNSLRVYNYATWGEIASILQPLLREGMVAEHWIPKLTLGEGAVDLRVLVVAGQPRHCVLRQSVHPMTNLHLGNRRADPARLGPWLEPARQLARQAAACFPHSHYAGVDILLDGRGRPWIGEINAFGDLLPGLLDRGESPYAAIARSWFEHHCHLV